MTKFTKEEISLCRQIAKRHRKEINQGDWIFWFDVPTIELIDEENYTPMHKKSWFPLWTISDCLEFLRKKDYRVKIESVSDSWFIEIWKIGHRAKSIKEWTAGLLETCLEAVLAVLEEGK